jgi:hypothetical protein
MQEMNERRENPAFLEKIFEKLLILAFEYCIIKYIFYQEVIFYV